MILLQSLLLIATTLAGSLPVLLIRKPSERIFKVLLMFSGGFLFAITVLNILPSLFSLYPFSKSVGLYVLIGFFMQMLLGLFSGGIEHGHTHCTSHHESNKHNISISALLISLCIHAFLDGVILSIPVNLQHHHHTHGNYGMLLGVLLHRMPEAFVLSSLLINITSKRRTFMLCLMIFALASPVGLFVSNYCTQYQILSESSFMTLMAIVGGNFLHIATTIFFESSPGHNLNTQKLMSTLAGAGLAIISEMLL